MKRALVLAGVLLSTVSACSLVHRQAASPQEPARVATLSEPEPVVAMEPAEAQRYALSLFSLVYYYGGYTWQTRPYAPGDFTQWSARNVSLGQFFEKALLKRNPDGSEWWRIRSVRELGKCHLEFAFEALLTSADAEGNQRILRLRSKLPGESTGHDIPLAASSLALKPTAHLSHLNLEWGTLGWEAVKVPAGLFRARHIRDKSAPGHPEWWLNHEVPGGVIQYSVPSPDGGALSVGEMELVKAGNDASTATP